MIYKRLSINHMDLLLKLNTDFRKDMIDKNNAKIFLENKENYIFVAILNNKIIGFLYGYELNRLDDKNNMLYIHEITINEEYRNLGYGYKLMIEFKKYCSQNNISKIFLFTDSNNIPAIKLYNKLNAEKAEEDSVYFIKVN